MAITALRSGCKLPISIDPSVKNQIVCRIPDGLENVAPRRYIHTPMPPISEAKQEDEPEVFDVY